MQCINWWGRVRVSITTNEPLQDAGLSRTDFVDSFCSLIPELSGLDV